MTTSKNISNSSKHHLRLTLVATSFSFILIFGTGGSGLIGLPLQRQQQEVYATSQVISSTQTPPSPTLLCNPNAPELRSGSTGAKVIELQRVLAHIGYGSLLGQKGIDGKFGPSTLNAVKKFQQDNALKQDGIVGQRTWAQICGIIPNSFTIQLKKAPPATVNDVRPLVSYLETVAGSKVGRFYPLFGMLNVKYEGPQTNIEQFINSLKAHQAVKAVYNDRIVTVSQLPPIPTGINRVDADLSAARSGDGAGTVDADIAIIDTGVSSHPDLNIFRCLSLVQDPIKIFPTCTDDWGINGHGTQVAGIAAALDNNAGVVGTAPGARIWAIKVFLANLDGNSDDIVAGMHYAAVHSEDIEVVNLSLTTPGLSIPEYIAIHSLILRGVVVVAAAGNNNIDAELVSPANVGMAITVSAITDVDGKCGGGGAAYSQPDNGLIPHQKSKGKSPLSNNDDFLATYSNYGPKVDIAAPGTNIESTSNKGGTVPPGYSGTSLAAPHVAGAAALYMSLHPNDNPIQVEAFLKRIANHEPASAVSPNPLLPCDGNGRGYFDERTVFHEYPARSFGDNTPEPLLHMSGIR